MVLNEIRMNVRKVLPFRFIAAARHNPGFEQEIETTMLRSLASMETIPGHTTLLVDVSGSMDWEVSRRSYITRMDAAVGVAMLLREMCEQIDIFSFSEHLMHIPARRGFALSDAIINSQPHSGTPLGLAVHSIYAPAGTDNKVNAGHFYRSPTYKGQGLTPDRLIVITDEQSCDSVPNPKVGKGYMINVATNKNGVGYGAWTHIDGWSEAVVNYIQEIERANLM